AVDPDSGRVNVVVDTPRGSRYKYKFDERHGQWLLSKVLPQGMCFPSDFGFIPSTRGEDGDPLDVLLFADEPALADPRITYKELPRALREASDAFDFVPARSPQLYAALWEVGSACRRLGLPCLPALVVRADTRRPGAAYFDGAAPRGEQVAAWRAEVEAVRAAVYPDRPPGGPRPHHGRQ